MMELAGWANFYVIVGSSAGALIGLQFVVMALLADLPRIPEQAQAGQAFASPNIVHFSTALLIAAVMCAPWRSIDPVTVILGVLGLFGMAYTVIVIRRMRTQIAYRPVFEDWLFHSLLPFSAYATLVVSSYAARMDAHRSLFAVASAALLLLFIGIHNAWDTATYHIFVVKSRRENTARSAE